jgi:hypothetical protein
VTVAEHVDSILSMILDDGRISTKKIAETLAISQEKVGYIIVGILDRTQLSVKWFPKYLKADPELAAHIPRLIIIYVIQEAQ